MKRSFAVACLIVSTLLLALFFWAPSQYVVPVLMYHSIDREYVEPLNNVRPENFARQMDFLKKGYKVISVAELVEGIKSGKQFEMNTVVITFDDGLQSNYTHAYPVLKARGLTATIFIPSDRIGDQDHLTWSQVREMSGSGFTIGSHMRTEAYLPDTHGTKLVSEIVDSKSAIEAEIGKPVDFLAYPVGGFTEEAKEIVRGAGYHAAFSTNRGYNRRNRDLFELKRVRIKDSDSGLVLWAKLSGFYNFFRSSKNPY